MFHNKNHDRETILKEMKMFRKFDINYFVLYLGQVKKIKKLLKSSLKKNNSKSQISFQKSLIIAKNNASQSP